MDRFFKDHSAIVLGSSVVVFLEVFPLYNPNGNGHHATVPLSAPFVKLHLQELALNVSSLKEDHASSIRIQWNKSDGSDVSKIGNTSEQHDSHHYAMNGSDNDNQLRSGYLFCCQTGQGDSSTTVQNDNDEDTKGPPVINLPSQNPLDLEPIPCWIIGSALEHALNKRNESSTSAAATITEGTLVRIMPPLSNQPSSSFIQHDLNELVGETESLPVPRELEEELVHNHSPATIRELSLRMSLQLSERVLIGTTSDALRMKRRQEKTRQSIGNGIQAYCARKFRNSNRDSHVPSESLYQSNSNPSPRKLPSIMREGALLVHCPNHGTGKTMLVKMIAQQHLKCSAVHIIQPGPLLAKYGSQADSALESILHAITLSAAVSRKGSICIILDHFDAMMPPKFSGRSSAGDAAAPVLNAVASYLKLLVLSLKMQREFLFPSKNPLYNVAGKGGGVLAVKICLVAVVTCPDDGWRSEQSNGGSNIVGHSTCILDALPFGRYRLPSSSAETRLKAFEWAFQKEQVALTEAAREHLPLLAASAVWCRGNMFQNIAKSLRQRLSERNNQAGVNQQVSSGITSREIEYAFMAIGKGNFANSEINFLASDNVQEGEPGFGRDAFSFVGGNSDAKRSLEDALALDPTRRALLNTMGIGSPIGVLLYGAPGNGKTLMAKAVARLLRAPGSAESHIGGAFVSLNSSDIVQAEVGSSEKLIASAFQTARENAPSVVFIDEFQALFTERSRSGSGKLSSTLLQCMDDIKLWRDSNRKATQHRNSRLALEGTSLDMDLKDNVLVLGATNTPWMVDKAFLRPGRFDRLVHVGLPSMEDRESILYVHMCKMKIKDDGSIQSACKNIAQETQGFSGADLAALCRAAAVRCLLENSEWIEERHFLQELSDDFVASSSAGLVQRNERWRP